MKQSVVLCALLLSFFSSGTMQSSQGSQVVIAYLKPGGTTVIAPRGGIDKEGFKVPYRFKAKKITKARSAGKKVAHTGSFSKKIAQ